MTAISPQIENARPGLLDYGLLILLAAIWGGSFLLIKVAGHDVPPATMATLRLILAAIVMIVIASYMGERIVWSWRTVALLAGVGLFGNALPFTLIAWGEQVVDAGLAAILMGIMPIFTLILAHFFSQNERLTAVKMLGVLIGFVGIIILVGPAVLSRLGHDGISQLAILGASLSYGVNAIMTKALVSQPRIAASAGLLLAGAVMVAPVALWLETPFDIDPQPASIVAVVLLGLLPTALAAILMFKVLERQGAGFFGQVNLLVPIFGVTWGFLILGERPELTAFWALGLILVGIWIARRNPKNSNAVSEPQLQKRQEKTS